MPVDVTYETALATVRGRDVWIYRLMDGPWVGSFQTQAAAKREADLALATLTATLLCGGPWPKGF